MKKQIEIDVEIYESESIAAENHRGKSRFIIISDSISAHCCFEYSIIDTDKKGDGIRYWGNAICETFDRDDAIAVCYALNHQFRNQKP